MNNTATVQAHTAPPYEAVPLSTGNFAISAGNPPECIAKVFRLQADNAGRDNETAANAAFIVRAAIKRALAI